ncbi:PTS sugar transporter [Candidatus Riesia sp. GBBU]|nr:PTS sugar transporter [Candidatus Riesia sp. GBBU]ARC55062.1 PTS sugar transporter [Candidatus Riesia sp. GBBU]
MFQKEVTINSPNGLHIRPAVKFVKEAKNFSSKITIKFGEKIANAKSLFKLQRLGLKKGSVITILAEGQDEEKAVEKLSKIILELE